MSIQDFELVKPISKGAYGRVFLARKKNTGDIYAIKVMNKRELLRKNQNQHIQAERQIMSHADNPFVVKLFYSFQSKNHLYLVMEFVNGGDMYSMLQNVGCLNEDAARIYAAELVLALSYLHEDLHVIHRDLKPDNILISKDGFIKLIDFGKHARCLAESPFTSHLQPRLQSFFTLFVPTLVGASVAAGAIEPVQHGVGESA